MTNTNLVVIDLGSNSVRMQISQIDDYEII